MNAWKWEIFEDAINSVPCTVTDPGPLRAPIKKLSVRRNDDRELVLEAIGPGDSQSSSKLHPAGTVRRNDDMLKFETPGFTAIARGVTPRSWSRTHDMSADTEITTETSSLHSLELTACHAAEALYAIDWIQNFDAEGFLFGNITDKSESVETRTLGRGPEAITLKSTFGGHSGGKQCLHLVIGGEDLYLGTARDGIPKTILKPGFILYKGNPDVLVRQKIRHCLSFALGTCFVYLGCTVLDTECDPISITAVDGDRFGDRIFKLVAQPPAPLERRYQHEVDPVALTRLANALYAKYDEVQLGLLSWTYWHALSAPITWLQHTSVQQSRHCRTLTSKPTFPIFKRSLYPIRPLRRSCRRICSALWRRRI